MKFLYFFGIAIVMMIKVWRSTQRQFAVMPNLENMTGDIILQTFAAVTNHNDTASNHIVLPNKDNLYDQSTKRSAKLMKNETLAGEGREKKEKRPASTSVVGSHDPTLPPTMTNEITAEAGRERMDIKRSVVEIKKPKNETFVAASPPADYRAIQKQMNREFLQTKRPRLLEGLNVSRPTGKCTNVHYWTTYSSKIFDNSWLDTTTPVDGHANISVALVVNDASTDNTSFSVWQLAQELSNKYKDFRHLYLDQPRNTKLSREEMLYWSPKHTHFGVNRKSKKWPYKEVTVQTMISKSTKWEFSLQNEGLCEEFAKFNETRIADPGVFSRNLLADLEVLKELLPKEPWLVGNFLIHIDHSGRFFHSNLDRKFKVTGKEEIFLWQKQTDMILQTLSYIGEHLQLPKGIIDYSCKNNEISIEVATGNSTFEWDMLEPSSAGKCGFAKCFFSAKSNPKHGYIVSINSVEHMKLAWERALTLENEFKAYQVYLTIPLNVTVNSKVMAVFKDATERSEKFEKGKSKLSVIDLIDAAADGTSEVSSFVLVQKVWVARPALEIGRRKENKRLSLEIWPEFLKQIPNKVLWHNRLLGQLPKFAETIAEEAWIRFDYQLFIDNLGRIIHFDFDRIKNRMGRYGNAKKFVRDIELIAEMRIEETIMEN
jgi:hypothetical protein